MLSCDNRDRSFSVETTISSEVARSLLVRALGKRSFADCKASIHMALSSLDTHLKWRVFVPVNMESRLSSDLLERTEETCEQDIFRFSTHWNRQARKADTCIKIEKKNESFLFVNDKSARIQSKHSKILLLQMSISAAASERHCRTHISKARVPDPDII